MDADRYLALVRRWWWLLLIGTVMAVAAYGIAVRIRDRAPEPATYTASAQLFVELRATADATASPVAVVDRPWDLDRLMASYATMLSSRAVAERAASDLRIDASPDKLRSSVRAQTIPLTQLIQLTTSAATPADAETLRDAVLLAFAEVRGQTGVPGSATVFETQPAVLDVQNKPSESLTVLLVAVAGLVSAAGIVLAYEYLSDAVRDARDAEKVTKAPVLASIPVWSAGKGGGPAIASGSRRGPAAAAERYRMLRTAIGLTTQRDGAQVLLVTGGVPSSGTTTTAANIAAALAQGGRRVVLVDANLRQPALHRVFGADGGAGLADVLGAAAALDAVVRDVQVEGLSVVTAGSPAGNPSELLDSTRFDELLGELRSRFDAVVLDSPPALMATDATVLAAKADATIVVVRSDRTARAEAAATVEMLRRATPSVIGVVLNGDANVAGGGLFGLRIWGESRHNAEARA